MPNTSPSHDRLVRGILDLHYHASDPFRVFITAVLRRIGYPYQLQEPEPHPGIADDLDALIQEYFKAVAAAPPFLDILGPVYTDVSSAGRKSRAGQFFTPWALSLMMSQMTLGDWKPEPNPDNADGRWTLLEPTVGSGGMLLAALAHVVDRHGPDALRLWDITAMDVDLDLARTCALQVLVTLAYHGWALGRIQILHHNTLSMETYGVILDAEAAAGPGPEEVERVRRNVQLMLDFVDDERKRGAA
jgi:hypothetical protein